MKKPPTFVEGSEISGQPQSLRVHCHQAEVIDCNAFVHVDIGEPAVAIATKIREINIGIIHPRTDTITARVKQRVIDFQLSTGAFLVQPGCLSGEIEHDHVSRVDPVGILDLLLVQTPHIGPSPWIVEKSGGNAP